MYEYIDVRGAWPVYVSGCTAVTLRNAPRSISVEQARDIAQRILEQKDTTPK